MDLPKSYKPQEVECRWEKYWEENNLFAWDPDRGRDDTFVVDTPPPTVSGSLHVGHLFSYSHQDFIVRYQRMLGKNIFFPIGWDDNGLPTERRVMNVFNVRCDAHLHFDPEFKRERGAKGDTVNVSRPNFINLCHEITREDEDAFKRLWSRLGLSYDWSQEYATIDDHCRYISQYSFLELLEKDEVFQAERPVLWDVDFQTAIAQAEVEDRDRPSAYNFLRFGVMGSDENIVIATTRPELLAACVAVLAHPEDTRYQHLFGKFAVTPFFQVPVPIMADTKADPEKGTGIVMVCTFGDQTDVEWWQHYNLPTRQIIGADGCLMPMQFSEFDGNSATDNSISFQPGGEYGVPSLDPEQAASVYEQINGLYTKKAAKVLLELAEEMPGNITRPPEEITHAVKFFEKGDRPLELIPTRQWYARIMDKKAQLIEQGRKIQWHPDYMFKRYEHWVEGLNQDWCLSRQRFFGVPIPLWYKIDSNGMVQHQERLIPEVDRLPIDPFDDVPTGYTEEQRDKPGGFTGDPDVFDTWATSSLTPQIATKWVRDKERHKKLFPMDIRPQAHDIIRTWAFYTIVKAYLHEGEIPWKNIVLSGWILDPDRKKMSKSKGNVVTPEPLVETHSADSLRYWAARARLGVDTAYDEQVFKVGKRLVTKLFNAGKFVIGRFSEIDAGMLTPDKIIHQTDRAVVAELRPLIARSTAALNDYDYAQALSLIEDFFWRVFCDNYLELAKPRTYDETLTPERLSACATLKLVHRALLRMFAPFVPYITEEVWSWTYASDDDMHLSVHRSPWPTIEELASIPEPELESVYAAAVEVIESVRRAKADANMSMAAPVDRVDIEAEPSVLKALHSTKDDIMRMLKIESLGLNEGKTENGLVKVNVVLSTEKPS